MPVESGADAKVALVRLRALLDTDTTGADAQELIHLAASTIADAEMRAKLADTLIAALTVIRFAPVFGNDPQTARQQADAVMAAIAAAQVGAC